MEIAVRSKVVNAFLRYHEFFGTIISYREYLKQSIQRDLAKRYKRSSLGYVWSMLSPLLMITVLTVIFSHLLPRVENYSVFLFSGLIGWQYFTGTVNESLNCIRGNMKIIEQVPIPKFIFAVSIACSNLVNFFLTMVPMLIVMVWVGRPFHWTALLFPVVLLPLVLITMGISLLFAVSNVFFEDTKHLSRIMLQAWYYFTPVLYGPSLLPEHVVRWLKLNPLFYPIHQMRGIFYHGVVPEPLPYLVSLFTGLFLLAFALWVFKRADQKFIYFV